MLLAIDIGNTTTKFGVFDQEKIVSRFVIPTVRTQTERELTAQINEYQNFPIDSAIISSVVPEVHDAYRAFFENSFQIEPILVDSNFDFGFSIKYNPPENLGIDRAIAAFAAVQKYGKPCIICDFGTATTIDVVNSKNEFLGGIIVAGIQVVADSLFGKTSKLPKIELVRREEVIGNSTVSAIQSGVYFGYLGLVEGIISRICSQIGEKPPVIATGGFAKLIAEGTKLIDFTDENLILDGLRTIAEKHHR